MCLCLSCICTVLTENCGHVTTRYHIFPSDLIATGKLTLAGRNAALQCHAAAVHLPATSALALKGWGVLGGCLELLDARKWYPGRVHLDR